ncbi:DNA replication and repair protein RadC [Clostridium aceticum]|uniref:DNA replication and repair protein RadC n=1 Tax=Clostridium aceticum TaxID=84022 RepID=A0A0D8ICH4_9CLOT|nr:DNA repair protein RadC [Clostridium aceticum]AKL95090.1 DNA replication and repair protein RadC [Clostridium aceticum]KJF27973.1 DNA repair protein RadC [Clostridium aceticum]
MNIYTTIKEMPEYERPREKMVTYGVNTLSNAELLAILLSTGFKEMSAIGLANSILSSTKEGLRFFTDCTIEELIQIKGVGLAKATQIIAAVELGKRIALTTKANNYRIKGPDDVTHLLMEEMRYLKKEFFNIILLNTKNELIAVENISIGSLNASIVHPREVFVRAIKRSSASMILVHNHPSGDPQPSKEDINITNRLVEAGKLIGIEILDHIIIGDNVYISLKEKNMM